LSAKFEDCATRTLGSSAARDAWNTLTEWFAGRRDGDVRTMTALIAGESNTGVISPTESLRR
jgi:hypothetical protein